MVTLRMHQTIYITSVITVYTYITAYQLSRSDRLSQLQHVYLNGAIMQHFRKLHCTVVIQVCAKKKVPQL
jgi:hypothetical protein